LAQQVEHRQKMLAQDMAVGGNKPQGEDIRVQKAGPAQITKVLAHSVKHRPGIGRNVKTTGYRRRSLGRCGAGQFGGDIPL
jgi:hypothetical protein